MAQFRRALGWVLLACGVLVTPAALAQNLTVTNVERAGAGYDGDQAFYISRADCEAEEIFEFPWEVTDLSGVSSLAVWTSEGADCTLAEERQSDGGCVEILEVDPTLAGGVIELTADAIANSVPGIDGCLDSSTSSTAHSMSIYFLLLSGAGADVPDEDAVEWTSTKVDLVGPKPPDSVTAEAADEAVSLTLSGNLDQADAAGFQAYCDGSVASLEECESAKLEAGGIPPSGSACGDPIQQGASLTVSGLANDKIYAVGVAGVDDLGNPGKLSEIVCVSPVPSDDFFETYRRAGGQGGCQSTPALGGGGAWVTFALGLALAAARSRRARSWASGAVLAVALGHASEAVAEEVIGRSEGPSGSDPAIPENDWRQTSRPTPAPVDTQFFVEMRFAPYWPAVDSEAGLSGAPYESTFGTDAQFYFGLELDWLPARIPYVGALGPGIGWGYTWATANAKITGCEVTPNNDCLSSDETTLAIMPMHVSAVLRLDELMRRTGVPLVPHAKLGFAVAHWSSDSTAGQSSVEEDGTTVDAEDVSIGLNVGLGLSLALNWLDTRAASNLYDATGIGHTYLFGEWMLAALDGFGREQMNVGTSTGVVGLGIDF